eukprot:355947-Chlamydomonas_euryale.AAC.2
MLCIRVRGPASLEALDHPLVTLCPTAPVCLIPFRRGSIRLHNLLAMAHGQRMATMSAWRP